nr:hypothetical protein [Bacillota bacterium]
KERKVNAGVMSPEDFWEQTAAMCSRTWDLCAVERCWLGSDGAAWLKQGMEVFPVIIGGKIPKNIGLLFPKKIGVISPKSSE